MSALGFGTYSCGTEEAVAGGVDIGKVDLGKRFELIACRGEVDSCKRGCCVASSSRCGASCILGSHSLVTNSCLILGSLGCC